MKANELRGQSSKELQAKLVELYKQQFQLRMQRSNEEQTKTHLFKQVRREIARIKTLLSEQERQA